jgi:O-antigen ligase
MSSANLLSADNEFPTLNKNLGRIMHVPLMSIVGVCAIFFVALYNHIDLEVDNQKLGLDLKVLIKLGLLGIGGLYGFVGFVLDPRVRQLLLSWPLFWMVIVCGFFFLAVPGSVLQTESLASTISIVCVLMMMTTAMVQLGTQTILRSLFWAMSVFVSFSWVVFFVWPELGVFDEPLPDAEVQSRMSGLSHPNTLGQFCGLTIILGLILYRDFDVKSWIRFGVVAMAFGALLACLSRTSLVATVFAIAILYRKQLLQPKYTAYYLGLVVLGMLGLMVLSVTSDLGALIESKLSFLSKSGDTSELTTATGRSDIWAYAIKLIGERPLTGYGAGTSKQYLIDYSLYTHNMILNVAFSAGVLAAGATIAMCIGGIRSMLSRPHSVADPLVAFILMNGLAENVIFSILCGFPTMIWILAIGVRRSEEIRSADYDNELSVRLKNGSLSGAVR